MRAESLPQRGTGRDSGSIDRLIMNRQRPGWPHHAVVPWT
jgi:hypothetical protein